MQIDFHFGATYAAARAAGFTNAEALKIATSAQYVDDTVNSGIVHFRTGQAYARFSTAHVTLDAKNLDDIEDRRVWVPFHFLPGNNPDGPHTDDFYNRMVCRPHSNVAKAMARAAIGARDARHALHRLGITAHVFIDTWAHQGFAGLAHPCNTVTDVRLHNSVARDGLMEALGTIQNFLLNKVLVGHGSAAHCPDLPFLQWEYTDGHGVTVRRDNPKDFLTALDELTKVFRQFRLGDPSAVVEGLTLGDRAVVDELIRTQTNEDGWRRLLEGWIPALKAGRFSFGPANPPYYNYGPGSWKHEALGVPTEQISETDRFEYRPAFLNCDWKLFHDAARIHQAEVLHALLPEVGLCAV